MLSNYFFLYFFCLLFLLLLLDAIPTHVRWSHHSLCTYFYTLFISPSPFLSHSLSVWTHSNNLSLDSPTLSSTLSSLIGRAQVTHHCIMYKGIYVSNLTKNKIFTKHRKKFNMWGGQD